ncbi:MAG: acetate kinase [Sulfurimonas sp.]|nr:acetate kinase [Sulfurimonas sp.]
MKIAIINSGSSSIKCKVFLMPSEQILAHIVVEKIGETLSLITLTHKNNKHTSSAVIATHQEGLKRINNILNEYGIVANFASLDAMGHRVVHGGESYKSATLIDSSVIKKIEKLIPLAPLHNGVNLEGILISQKKAPSIAHFAIFDTAFHATMPKEAYMYALPYELYEKHKIRKYGFHGTSHAFVMKEAAKAMHRDAKELNIITLHLGNGASVCAIQNGKSVDTSMGFTPLEGLIMGSRCGDLDPAILLYLQRELGLSTDEIDDLLNKQSGLLGICGEKDVREIKKRDDALAHLALEMMVRRVKKYIGSYIALLGGVDALVFTAGIGERSSSLRAGILQKLELFGIAIDKEANEQDAMLISSASSKIKVFVIKTDEELEMARECAELLR